MKSLFTFCVAALLTLSACCNEPKQVPMNEVVTSSLDFCVAQAMLLGKTLESQEGAVPVGADWNGHLRVGNATWWTSGFFPGELWYLYEHTGDPELKRLAEIFTQRIEGEQHTTNNHDVGFMIYCSVGNQFRLTGADDERLKEIILTTANSLSTRWRPAAQVIQSWDVWKELQEKGWQCPVIIDNMMNLELLERASELSGDPRYAEIARAHANSTLKNHFRADNSSYHVVDYNLQTGEVMHRDTWQGYSQESAWARGQAWGLYGYTMMYRETGDEAYLQQAVKIADYLLGHPRMPKDLIPYWDFDAPNIPEAYRDVSAGTIICSALIELSGYVDDNLHRKYLDAAETQLRALPDYHSGIGMNGGMILRHSVGSLPHLSEVDQPLIYADYYYVEALMRYKALLDS